MAVTGSQTARRRGSTATSNGETQETKAKRCQTPGRANGSSTHRGRSNSTRAPMTPKGPGRTQSSAAGTRTPANPPLKARNMSVGASMRSDGGNTASSSAALQNTQASSSAKARCASTARLPQKLRTRSTRFTGSRAAGVAAQQAAAKDGEQGAAKDGAAEDGARSPPRRHKAPAKSKSGRLTNRSLNRNPESPPKGADGKVAKGSRPSPVQPPALGGDDEDKRLSLTTVPATSSPATPETGSLCSARSTERVEKTIIGNRLDGLVVTDRSLGTGAFGEVYVGVLNGTEVAVKQIPRPQADPFGNPGPSPEEFRGECVREAELLNQLKHIHVLPLVGATVTDEEAVIVTGKCNPATLEDKMDRSKSTYLKPEQLKLKRALGWCRDIADGLSYVHSKQVVHRDVKPSNVLFTEVKEKVRVVDFGFAARLGEDMKASGTPNYVAPEVWQRKPHTYAQDVFSFGVLMLEVMTWCMLPELGSVLPTYGRSKRLHEIPSQLPLPTDVQEIMTACLQRDPDERPGMEEAAIRLSDIVDECPAEMTLAGPPGFDPVALLNSC